MMKKLITLLIAVLLVGTPDVSAQSFLEKLGKKVEKAVKDTGKKKGTVTRKSANTRVKSNNAPRKAAGASDEKKNETPVLNLPPRDHAFLAPMGEAKPGGTVEFVCPKPPSPDKDLSPWAEKLEPVGNLTNVSLLKEIKLLEPLIQREKYIINAMIDRYDKAYNEFHGRLKAIATMHAEVEKIHKMSAMHDPQGAINTRGLILERTLTSDVYHHAFRSSITVFRSYLDAKTVAWLDGLNTDWDALLTDVVTWKPYPDNPNNSTR